MAPNFAYNVVTARIKNNIPTEETKGNKLKPTKLEEVVEPKKNLVIILKLNGFPAIRNGVVKFK